MKIKEYLNKEVSPREEFICSCVEHVIMFICAALLIFIFFAIISLMEL